jgi:hypothetical protein
VEVADSLLVQPEVSVAIQAPDIGPCGACQQTEGLGSTGLIPVGDEVQFAAVAGGKHNAIACLVIQVGEKPGLLVGGRGKPLPQG